MLSAVCDVFVCAVRCTVLVPAGVVCGLSYVMRLAIMLVIGACPLGTPMCATRSYLVMVVLLGVCVLLVAS